MLINDVDVSGVPTFLQKFSGTAGGQVLNIGQAVDSNTFGRNYDLPISMSFNMAELANIQNWAILYDMVKLDKVVINVEYGFNSAISAVQNTYSGFMPTLYHAKDYDDAFLPTTVQTLRGRNDCKTHKFPKKLSISIVPRMRTVVQTTPSVANTQAIGLDKKPQWLDTAYLQGAHPSSAEMFGWKGFLTDLYVPSSVAGIPNQLFRFNVDYYVSFKHPQNAY